MVFVNSMSMCIHLCCASIHKTNKIDLQEIVKNTGAQTINAINEGIFDPETKKKLIDQAIIQQEKMISKINEGSVTTRDISDYKNKNQTIQTKCVTSLKLM